MVQTHVRRLVPLAAVLMLFTAGCRAPTAGSPSSTVSPALRSGIAGTAIAGPTCPVERLPPDPSCAARPVAAAVLLIRDASGAEVARAVTGVDGTYQVSLPPGDYSIEPRPVEGLMGTPGQEHVTVAQDVVSTIDLVYDTGIRGPALAPS